MGEDVGEVGKDKGVEGVGVEFWEGNSLISSISEKGVFEGSLFTSDLVNIS